MNNSRRFYLTSLAILLLFSGFYWLLPIPGHIAYIPDQQQDIWPQVTVLNRENGRFEVVVRDTTPWVHVRLEAAGVNTTLESYGTQDIAGTRYSRRLAMALACGRQPHCRPGAIP
jgi:hypothetical protein